jgi:hypothetical protein
MEDMRIGKVLVGKVWETDHLEDVRVKQRLILQQTLSKYRVRIWIGFIRL